MDFRSIPSPLRGRPLAATSASLAPAPARENLAYAPGFASGQIDPDEHEWRPVGRDQRKLDLSPEDWEAHVIQSYWQWFSNPMARRIIQITRDFTLGAGGIGYECDDDIVASWVDEHWSDARNDWGTKQFDRVQDMFLFGELIMPAFVKATTGRTRLGYIFPTQVERVETDPGNADRVTHIVLKDKFLEGDSQATALEDQSVRHIGDRRHGFVDPPGPRLQKRLKVIELDDNPASKTYGRLVGDVFYFAINKTGAGVRGTSDLLPLNEWLDSLDAIMLNRADDRRLQSAFVWDVELEGADQNDIDRWHKQHMQGPRPNQVLVHNERERWDVVSPNLNSGDAETDIRMLRQHILSGAGYPETWFADTANSNRASATEAGVPTFKQLQLRQLIVRTVFEKILRFVVDQKRIALPSVAKRVESFEVRVNIPQVERRDTAVQVGTLASWTQTVSTAEDRGYIRPNTARRAFAFMASQVGFEIDPEEEAEPDDDLVPDPDVELLDDDAAEVAIEEDADGLERYDETADDVAARYAGVTRQQVKGWAARGCPHFKNPVNRRCMFNGREVDAWLKGMSSARGPAASTAPSVAIIEGVDEAIASMGAAP